MTTGTPVGWPVIRPGVVAPQPSPEPVGWQGLSLSAETPSNDVAVSRETETDETGDTEASVQPDAQNSDLVDENSGDVQDEDIPEKVDQPEVDHEKVATHQAPGYDLLLGASQGSGQGVAPEEPDFYANDAARGDGESTVTSDDVTSKGFTNNSESALAQPLPSAELSNSLPEPDAGEVTSSVPEKIESDTALVAGAIGAAGAQSPKRHRKAGRGTRPRVPSFDQMTDPSWAEGVAGGWSDGEPAGDSTSVVREEDQLSHSSSDEHGSLSQSETERGLAETSDQSMSAGGDEAPRRMPLVSEANSISVEKLPRPAHPRVLTVANQKGGVGKTTTTVNVAAALAQAGLNVLVIDIDPQGNASTALGIDHHAEVPSVYDVIVDGKPLDEIMAQCPDIPSLWCAPATIDLAGAEIELVSLVARESRLHRAINALIQSASDDERFDYVFIDCPPSLGLLTVNAFVAADEVFIPIQCEYYALEGLSQLLKNIEMIKLHLNPGLHVSTILLTMYDGRTNLSAQVADEVRAHFPDQVLDALVPRSVRISEAPSHGETVMTYDPSSTGAKSYRDAARDLALRGVNAPTPSGRIGR